MTTSPIAPPHPPATLSSRLLYSDGDLVIAALEGHLDVFAAPAARRFLRSVLDLGLRVELDLRGIRSIDAAGVGVVVRAARAASEAGSLFAVAGPPLVVRELLRLTSADTVLAASDLGDACVVA